MVWAFDDKPTFFQNAMMKFFAENSAVIKVAAHCSRLRATACDCG